MAADSEKHVQNVAPSGGEYFNKMVTIKSNVASIIDVFGQFVFMINFYSLKILCNMMETMRERERERAPVCAFMCICVRLYIHTYTQHRLTFAWKRYCSVRPATQNSYLSSSNIVL